MASCGQVDNSVSALSSSMKGSGNSACSASSGSSPALPVPECAICLQTCVHPVQLPCRHVFCFLCVKGASWQSKRCALCRQEVPEDFLEHPTLLSPEELKVGGRGSTGDQAWYYEGRNGWWQYDERTSRELEDAFSKGKKTAEMLIAGFLYVADLENMVQYRRNEHGRRRKIKRDVVDIPKKGVAGLRLDTEGGAQGAAGAGREHPADGADTLAALTAVASAGLPAPARPPTSLGGQPGSLDSPSLEDALAQLHIDLTDTPERAEVTEGEEGEDEAATTPSRSSGPNTSVDESGDLSDVEDGEGQAEEPQEQRLHLGESSEDMAPSGAETASSSVRSRRPDGQCTVTEV